MTAHQKTALHAAGILFGTWLLLALAIADFPPPPGFVIVVLILLACALLVYLRVPVYLRWQAEEVNGSTLRWRGTDCSAAALSPCCPCFSPGEPSIQPDCWTD